MRAAPRYAKAHLNLGIGLEAQGRLDEAAASYEKALAIDPGEPYASYNLGKLLFTRDALEPAERHLQAALERRPAFPEACLVYALVLMKLDRLAQAEAAARRALDLDRSLLGAYRFLGDLLRSDGRHEEAAEVYRAARSAAGGGLECEQAELHALNHSDRTGEDALFARHKEVGARLEAAYPARFAPFANPRDPGRRLRIGYLSRDFYQHPVAWFLAPVLERHERTGFEVHCYASGARRDEMTARLRALAHRWHDVARMPQRELADRIHGDGIDILVDLLGHCADSDLPVFAQQPAPVQVSWLGYLNTTGLTRIQYRLTDAVSDPPGDADRRHTEKLVRLPHSQWCYRPVTSLGHAAQPPCVRDGVVTFGSFNHMLKLTPSVRALWKEILTRLPHSRLVILGAPPGPAQERLRAEFEGAGIAPARLTIVPPLPLHEYFRWFDAVDLALDTTPYSGGTTTCDTLWMGVPVVTLAAARPASRSAASILTAVGLAEWVARSPQDYVRLALDFARDPARLAALRAALRARMRASPVMDEPGFVRGLENAYRQMWRAWCEGAR